MVPEYDKKVFNELNCIISPCRNNEFKRYGIKIKTNPAKVDKKLEIYYLLEKYWAPKVSIIYSSGSKFEEIINRSSFDKTNWIIQGNFIDKSEKVKKCELLNTFTIFKNLGFIDLMITYLGEKVENQFLEILAINCLIDNRSSFDQKMIENVASLSKIPKIKLRDNKFIKVLETVKRYRFIRREFLYAFALRVITKKDTKFEIGCLKNIKDRKFLNSIDYLQFVKEHENYKKIELDNKLIIEKYLAKKEFEQAANQRDHLKELLKLEVMRCWPKIENINLENIHAQIKKL